MISQGKLNSWTLAYDPYLLPLSHTALFLLNKDMFSIFMTHDMPLQNNFILSMDFQSKFYKESRLIANLTNVSVIFTGVLL